MERLKQKWGLTSNWQVLTIIIVFSINGSFAVWVAKPVTGLFGLNPETEPYIFYLIPRILLIFVIYQITLLIVGWFFGQFKFFWEFEKKMFTRMGFGKFFN